MQELLTRTTRSPHLLFSG